MMVFHRFGPVRKINWLWILLILPWQQLGAQNPMLGNWEGTYRDQPPGGRVEPVKRFRLEFTVSSGELAAVFDRLAEAGPERKKVLKIRRVGEDAWSYCLDIEEEQDEVYAWSLAATGDKLQGVRNGGPCSELGIGPGARLFRVDGKRIVPPSDKPSDSPAKR
jgi:hypothetical protein